MTSVNSNALMSSGEGCDDTLQIQQASTCKSPQPPTDSPRKRRTGLHAVNQKPDISPDLVQEVESRIVDGIVVSSVKGLSHQYHIATASISTCLRTGSP